MSCGAPREALSLSGCPVFGKVVKSSPEVKESPLVGVGKYETVSTRRSFAEQQHCDHEEQFAFRAVVLVPLTESTSSPKPRCNSMESLNLFYKTEQAVSVGDCAGRSRV